MTSGGREVLKWVALVLMSGDHVAKVLFGGYVPVVSELGRIAFPLFAIVMACNLAAPGADIGKSFGRLAVWAVIAQPFHAWAFGYWLPLNVLASFALAAGVVWCIHHRRWLPLVLLVVPAPLLVDYQWSGLLLVVSWWWFFRVVADRGSYVHAHHYQDARDRLLVALVCFVPLLAYNGNAWALLALILVPLLGGLRVDVPRHRWAFYGYYVGHLAVLSLFAAFAI